MTGTDPAGVWGGYPPMPSHMHCMRLHRVDESMRMAKQNYIRNRLQRVLCGSIQHPITASGTHPHGMSDAVSECLGIAVVRKVNNPNRIKGLGGNGKFSPAINPPAVGVALK
jgi:hypothetical protein